MNQVTVPGQPAAVDLTGLFAQKGELITQLEIAQQKLNNINIQISQVFGQGQPLAK